MGFQINLVKHKPLEDEKERTTVILELGPHQGPRLHALLLPARHTTYTPTSTKIAGRYWKKSDLPQT